MAATKSGNGNGNGNGASREIYERIGNLEVNVKALATQLEGYAAHTSQAIEQLAKRIDGNRPPWIGIISVTLVVVGLCASLAASHVRGQTAPLERNLTHLKELIEVQIAARNRELMLRDTNEEHETKLRDEINALMHAAFDKKIAGVEERLRTRTSDADDRQDAASAALQKEIDLIRGKNP